MEFDDFARMIANFTEVGLRINQRWRRDASMGLELILKRLAMVGLGTSRQMSAAATEHLDLLKASKGYLSSDQAHARALQDTLCRLEAAQERL